MKNPHEDIDLLDLTLELWRSKWTVFFFIILSTLIGLMFIFFTKDDTKEINKNIVIYESKIVFSLNEILPPNHLRSKFYQFRDTSHTAQLVILDFHDLLYSEDNFQNWKNENPEFKIGFNQILDNNFFHVSKDKTKKYIQVKSDEISQFDGFYSYIDFTIKEQSFLYSKFLDSYLDEIYSKIEELSTLYPNSFSHSYVVELVRIENFMSSFKGPNLISIKNISKPKEIEKPKMKIVPKFSYLRIIIFAVFGGMLGAFFVLIRNAIIRRKKETS